MGAIPAIWPSSLLQTTVRPKPILHRKPSEDLILGGAQILLTEELTRDEIGPKNCALYVDLEEYRPLSVVPNNIVQHTILKCNVPKLSP
jgi:hypothetical protein